jgi:hypothetical protein
MLEMNTRTQIQKPVQFSSEPAPVVLLQRKCACGGNSSGLTSECAECNGQPLTLQRRAVNSNAGRMNESAVPPVVHETLAASGQSLDAPVRERMESHFGHNFSHVRIHTDARASESARAVSAQAYTVGRDVVFQKDHYQPQTAAGEKLLTHELAHVVQQSSHTHSAVNASQLEIGEPDSSAERQADEAAQLASDGGGAASKTKLSALPETQGSLAREPDKPLVAQKGVADAVYKMRFAQFGAYPMDAMLAYLNKLSRDEMLGLYEHINAAYEYGQQRIKLAMDVVWYRGYGRAIKPEFRSMLKAQMDIVIPSPKHADQQEAILHFFDEASIKKSEAKAAAATTKDKAKTDLHAVEGGGGPIPSESLTAFGTAEQTTFKRAVYNAQMANSMKAKKFFPGVAAADLEKVEGGQLRKDAAPDFRSLLTQARADLKKAQDEGDALATEVKSIGAGSTYRNPQEDFKIWDSLFEQYYNATKKAREAADGGEHGAAAVSIMVGHYSGRKAPPGFSNHTSGIAVDFVTKEGKDDLGANVSQNERWKKSWLHQWLVKNAATYNFHPLATEAFHWNHEAAKE